jgi:hypothetical protein
MRWWGRTVLCGGLGGALAGLIHGWMRGLPWWQPGRLVVAVAVGIGAALLFARFLWPNES